MDACRLEIYQNPQQFNRYYCKVIVGEAGFVDGATFVFKPQRTLYNIPLNGPGRNKAEKKIRAKLISEGLDLMILKEN
jgi:hypothetical protein